MSKKKKRRKKQHKEKEDSYEDWSYIGITIPVTQTRRAEGGLLEQDHRSSFERRKEVYDAVRVLLMHQGFTEKNFPQGGQTRLILTTNIFNLLSENYTKKNKRVRGEKKRGKKPSPLEARFTYIPEAVHLHCGYQPDHPVSQTWFTHPTRTGLVDAVLAIKGSVGVANQIYQMLKTEDYEYIANSTILRKDNPEDDYPSQQGKPKDKK